MILNAWTVVAIFLAGLGALLALAWLALSWRAAAATNASERTALEERADRLRLAGVVGAVLLVVRLVDWPLFYGVLESYVPALSAAGAMCAYGVVHADPTRVLAILLVAPIALVALGFLAVLGLADRRGADGGLARTRAWLAVPIACLVLAQCALELNYFFREKLGTAVTCCSQGGSAAIGAGSAIDASARLWSLRVTPMLAWSAYFGGNAVLIALCAWQSRARRESMAVVLALLGLGNLALTHDVWAGVLAPRVLGLPYHHCVYELLTRTLALGPAALCAFAGNACLLWPLALAAWRKRMPDVVDGLAQSVYRGCALALATELVLVAVHAV